MSIVDIFDSEVPNHVVDSIFGDVLKFRILPEYFHSGPSDNPRAVIVGGQPGAGKTATRATRAPQSKFCVVNGDDLRVFHPQYTSIVQQCPERMPDITADLSGKLVAKSIQWLMENRWNVVWETTFRSDAALLRDLHTAVGSGYQVGVYALGVAGEVSLHTTVARWCREMQTHGFGRVVSVVGHDEPYAKAPAVLDQIGSELPTVGVHVSTRSGALLGEDKRPSEVLTAARQLGRRAAGRLEEQVYHTKVAVSQLPPSAGREHSQKVLELVSARLGESQKISPPNLANFRNERRRKGR